MTTVVYIGELGRLFGDRWRLSVSTLGEAIRAIDANTGGRLLRYLATAGNGYAGYRVLLNDADWHRAEELLTPRSLKTMHIMPAVSGAGSNNGLWQILAGVVLIALSAVLTMGASSPAFLSTGFFSSGMPAFVFAMGASLMLGGVASFLAPSPKTSQTERPENQPSYMFSGAVNTYRQGNPVPIGYGMMLTGSQVVGAGIRATDLPMVEKWNSGRIYVRGSEVFYNSRYYRARSEVPAGKIPDQNPDYWDDDTTT